MNSKQFVNSSILRLLEPFKWVWVILRLIPKFIFPDFLFIFLRKRLLKQNIWVVNISVYVFIFITVFLVQAIWSYLNGRYFEDNLDITKNFLEDTENILNYTLVVQGYCIAGFWFLYHQTSIQQQLFVSLTDSGMKVKEPDSGWARGLFGLTAAVLVALFSSVGYATEALSYPQLYWFAIDSGGNHVFGPAGFYYAFINFFLLLFICIVGISHFGLFKLAATVNTGLKEILKGSDMELIKNWSQNDAVKVWLEPFSRLTLLSKTFLFFIALNLLTWKVNEDDVGVMYQVSLLLLFILGIWVFSLPRYAIQLQIFRIREKAGVQEYKDIRLPWVLGASALIDVAILTLIGRFLLNETVRNSMTNFFS